MDMCFWLFDQKEVSERLLGLLIFELEQLERQIDQVGPAEAELVDGPFVGFV